MGVPTVHNEWFCLRETIPFQLNPPSRVGEILLCNVKSSLCSGEITAAVGEFHFICEEKIVYHREILANTVRICYDRIDYKNFNKNGAKEVTQWFRK